MKKLEEEFNLASFSDVTQVSLREQLEPVNEVVIVEEALNNSEKINNALKEVRGLEAHDREMDDIAVEAMQSYRELMSLGMNIMDMAAGPIFSNAVGMLKVALEAKDSKVNRKLKQLDLMLKKARLDKETGSAPPMLGEEPEESTPLDRNQLLKMISRKRV